jgi:hypothetical protein
MKPTRLTFKFIFLTIFFAVVASSLSAQEVEKINYHQYKNEIGIDMQHIFGTFFNGTPGLGARLIYKHRKPATGLIAVNEKTAYRIQLGIVGALDLGDRQFDTLESGFFALNVDGRDNLYCFGAVGIERQMQRGRLQYFLGGDLGYAYRLSEFNDYFRIISLPSGKTEDFVEVERTVTHGPMLIGFFGFKYFILPEISLSLETGFQIAYEFNQLHQWEKNLSNGEVGGVQKGKYNTLRLELDYLRALNLSYYF